MFTPRELEVAASAVVRLFRKWDLPDGIACQILGNLASETYSAWQRSEFGQIDQDVGIRLSLLIGIHKCLRTLFKDPERGYAWIRIANSAFNHLPPLEVMAKGDIASLAYVRARLETMMTDVSSW
ncbi:MAG: DUF2384 domain-containing protein [Bosea sp.]|uniref:antitoxin Xre/MbcA/ParS toxin-binding domain-containing protein n=1 Tax=Bosea sp. (in: a-proteobacteria) TaxID=1871050 RepID=UPI002399DEE1|nr:DUF2384 domain-containing protein [Bosea sp. (in: a-proteobacteria)]MCP4738127.1 DUF2384 domain-containing protein [Bosea sp. (in: a-proteobacteria)]